MTQAEVTAKLMSMRFVGKYSYAELARQAGLATDTIRRAMQGEMSSTTQTRIEMLFRQIPDKAPVRIDKKKPGHRKRFLIRHSNLLNWIAVIESVTLKNPSFHINKRYYMSTTVEAGYTCTKLDYMLKYYLMKVFGDELKKKKVFLGDCYSAEKWIERISKALPNYKRDLIVRLQHRKGIQNGKRKAIA